MFQLVCHASLFYFKDQSGRQRKSGVCTEQGLPAFLMAEQLLLILACVAFTSLSCFLPSTRTTKPAFRHTQPTGAAPGVAICTQGKAHMCGQNRHAHVCVQTALGRKISWRLVVFFSPLLLVVERERN